MADTPRSPYAEYVPEYLSAEWVAALHEALAANDELRDAVSTGADLVIEYKVDDHTHQVHLGPSGVGAQSGNPQAASVTFSQSLETAQAVSSGQLSGEEAFITGRITFVGDIQMLLDHREALAQVGDITASLRSGVGAPE